MKMQKASSAVIKFIPAIVLTLVAFNQIYWASTKNLSPWKGGGFGMFATIDSAGSRLLTCEGVDQEGNEVICQIPDAIRKDKPWQTLTSLPKQDWLINLADRILASEFIETKQNTSRERTIMIANNSDQTQVLSDYKRFDKPIYRVKSTQVSSVGGRKVIRLENVRLQMWKRKFKPKEKEVYFEKLGSPVFQKAIRDGALKQGNGSLSS